MFLIKTSVRHLESWEAVGGMYIANQELQIHVEKLKRA